MNALHCVNVEQNVQEVHSSATENPAAGLDGLASRLRHSASIDSVVKSVRITCELSLGTHSVSARCSKGMLPTHFLSVVSYNHRAFFTSFFMQEAHSTHSSDEVAA